MNLLEFLIRLDELGFEGPWVVGGEVVLLDAGLLQNMKDLNEAFCQHTGELFRINRKPVMDGYRISFENTVLG